MFLSSEVTEKRAFLNFLLQNPVLRGRKLLFKLKSPFDVIVHCGKTQDWLPGLDDVDNKSVVFRKLHRMAPGRAMLEILSRIQKRIFTFQPTGLQFC